jgi:hypothetical protein
LNSVLYGVRNCDTVKKARSWLDSRGIGYEFHDAGTTFRKLPDTPGRIQPRQIRRSVALIR